MGSGVSKCKCKNVCKCKLGCKCAVVGVSLGVSSGVNPTLRDCKCTLNSACTLITLAAIRSIYIDIFLSIIKGIDILNLTL
jgi:hypothetical protein